jgi:hypothetical protein
MFTRSAWMRLAAFGALLLSLAASTQTAHAQRYSIRELGPYPGGLDTFGNDISRNGAVIGTADHAGVFWPLAGGQPIGAFTSRSGLLTFYKVNDLAQIAGWVTVSNGHVQPIVYTAGQVVPLDFSDFYQGEARCVSNFFDDGYYGVVGRVFHTDNLPDNTPEDAPIRKNRAAVWNKAGDRILLPVLGTDSYAESLPGNIAMSIGSGLLAAGSSAMVGKTHEQAVVWSTLNKSIVGWLNDPDHPGMGVGGRVNDNRDNRYMCGYYYASNSADPTACYWSSYTSVKVIGSLYGGFSQALAVRDSNYTTTNRPEIVGQSQDPTAPSYHSGFTLAFRYNTATGLKDLNNLLLNRGGWTLRSASGIDPDGRIVGWGQLDGATRGFILIPLKIKAVVASSSVLSSAQRASITAQMLEAVPEDTVLTVRCSDPTLLHVPDRVIVKRGESRVSFVALADRIPAKKAVTITVSLDELSESTTIQVQP